MPKLQNYTEKLSFRAYPSHRVLLPADLDLAIQRLEIQKQDDELKRLETMGEPAEIRETRRKLSDLEGAELELAKAKLFAFDSRRAGEQDARLADLWRSQHVLEQMEAQEDAPDSLGGAPEHDRFEMREFSKGERQEVDSHFEVLHDLQDGRKVKIIEDVGPRNLELLGKCLLGEWLPEAGLKVVDEAAPVKDWGDVRYRLVAIENVTELQDTLAEVLINRMWAKNTMAPALAGFFVRGRRPSRLTENSATS